MNRDELVIETKTLRGEVDAALFKHEQALTEKLSVVWAEWLDCKLRLRAAQDRLDTGESLLRSLLEICEDWMEGDPDGWLDLSDKARKFLGYPMSEEK